MATPIEMPQPGNTVEECILVRWTVKPGDRVTAGEVIAEIETDKADFDVETPVDGVLLETFFSDGDLVPVLTNICVVGDPGEEYEKFRPQKKAPAASAPAPVTSAPSPPRAAVAAPPETVLASAPTVPVKTPPAAPAQVFLSPRARRFAEEHHFHPENVTGSGPNGRILESDLKVLYAASPRASFLARELIEHGYEARGEGSGVDGLILARDLVEPPVKQTGIRQTIARRMRESLATTAQYTLHASADATSLLALRRQIKAANAEGRLPDININDLVMFCAVQTLKEIPGPNAELVDGRLYRHSRIHLGFACDTEKGLVVPVVKDAQKMTVAELAGQVHSLAEQAVNGTLSPDDMTGGTFTVSNLGGLGVEFFTPVINPPQVAVLGMNAIQLKPVRRGPAVEFVDHIGFSLTCDHQVVDGAPGARFLRKLSENIEAVETVAGLKFQEK